MPTAVEIVIDALVAQMLLDGRRDEVQRLLAQFRLWQLDVAAVGPELAAFLLVVDRIIAARSGDLPN